MWEDRWEIRKVGGRQTIVYTFYTADGSREHDYSPSTDSDEIQLVAFEYAKQLALKKGGYTVMNHDFLAPHHQPQKYKGYISGGRFNAYVARTITFGKDFYQTQLLMDTNTKGAKTGHFEFCAADFETEELKKNAQNILTAVLIAILQLKKKK